MDSSERRYPVFYGGGGLTLLGLKVHTQCPLIPQLKVG
jgi:hypothetical protein